MNHSEALSEEDERLLEATHGMETIVIVNKTDLPQALDYDKLEQLVGHRRIVTTSILQDEGIDELEQEIAKLFFEGNMQGGDMTYVSNARHIALLHQAKQTIEDALEATEQGVPVDMIQIDVTRTWEILGEIVGDTVEESLIDQLFAQFCLGK